MKKLILLIVLINQLSAFGQTQDQQLIPEFALKGKSASELRIMRNEIFAKYGYIFNSQDLSEYFKSKFWYKPTKSNVDDKLTDIDKSNIKQILKFENLAKTDSFNHSSETNAYFRIYEDPITGDRLKTTRDVTFHGHYTFGTIRKIVERTFTGGEKIPTVVYAESTDPSKPFWKTTKYFNDLKFSTNYYHAIEYGCCGAENYGELFSYNSTDPFLKFNESYFSIDVPNSKIQMFIGYCHEDSGRDGLEIAKLYLSTVNGIVNSITFMAATKEDKEDLIWYFRPKVILTTKNARNKISRNGEKIELWGSNFAKSTLDINDFSIFIEFTADGTEKISQFDIPIINGKLNGSKEINTKLVVELK